jgi:hypothetical protein
MDILMPRGGREDRDRIMLDELSVLAAGHVATSEGKLELLEIDTVKYPAQATNHVEGEPAAAAVVESIATTADDRFPWLSYALQAEEDKNHSVSLLGEILAGGNNVMLVTNHGDLIDIALVEAAVYSILDKKNYQFRSSIVISKMVSMLAYKLGDDAAPAADVLKLLCNDIYLSFPRTESVKKSGLGKLLPDLITRENKKLRAIIDGDLEEGNMLLGIAGSGTTDKLSPTIANTYVLGSLATGTARMMMQPRTYVQPVAVWLKGKEPYINLCGIPRIVASGPKADEVMTKISDNLEAKVPDTKFVYSMGA